MANSNVGGSVDKRLTIDNIDAVKELTVRLYFYKEHHVAMVMQTGRMRTAHLTPSGKGTMIRLRAIVQK
jgi:hypothetical protein